MKYMQRWEELQMERDEARAEGREEGREEGRNSMAQLVQKLLETNRIEDCKKAAEDPQYCKLLLKEFGIEESIN